MVILEARGAAVHVNTHNTTVTKLYQYTIYIYKLETKMYTVSADIYGTAIIKPMFSIGSHF